MSNEDDIAKVAVEFEMTTGKAPTKLYLGYKTHYDVMSQARQYMTFNHSLSVNRQEYRGMAVYLVNDRDYIAVGL